MLFSIIIPVYNIEDELRRCLDSALNQTLKDFEVILIDDGSTDKSGEICDEYGKLHNRVKVIHKENGGVSSARNVGLNKAKGKFIAFIDSDDYVNDDYLEKLYNPNVDMVFCGIKHKKIERDIILNNEEEGIFDIKGNVINKLIDSRYINTVYSKMYINQIIQEHNIRFREDMPLGEDTVFIIDYIEYIKNIEVKNDIIYNYIQYERETLSSFNEKSTYYLEILDDYIEKNLFEKYNIEPGFAFKKRKWGKYEWTIFQTLYSEKFSFIKKREILNKVFKNENYIKLVKDIDDYMPNDTQIVRDILSTKNTNIVMIFFFITKLKSLVFNKIKNGGH